MSAVSQAIFLSYASDDAEAAARIAAALSTAGLEVWFDKNELRGGDVWDQKIRHQIRDCALFIPVISAHTQARTEGYFRLEWRLADQRTHLMARNKPFIVPVCVDDTADSEGDMPDSFLAAHWSRFPGGETPPAFAQRITQLLTPQSTTVPPKAQAPSSVSSSTAPRQSAPAQAASQSIWRRPLPWGLAAAAVIVVGYLIVSRQMRGGSSASAPRVGSPAITAMTPPGPVPERSIAVLPFQDLSEKHDQEYFADGMAEEILNLLTKVPGLKVIGRTSSFQFKTKSADLRQIGATLSAAYVVEGSVRRAAGHIRVVAQLIDTRDGIHRWSDTYDRDAVDTLKIQEDIAASLVRALQVEVDPSTAFPFRSRPQSQETYDLYLRGLHAIDTFNEAGFEQASVIFRRVLERDSSFVPAAEALIETLTYLTGYGLIPAQPGFQQLREISEATLRLDPDSALAHSGLANVHEGDYNWTAAEDEVNASLKLAPNNPSVLLIAADQRFLVGQWDEAAHLLDRLRAIDPLRPSAYLWSCWVYPMLSRLTEAEMACRRALEISPQLLGGYFHLGYTLLLQGRADAALMEMQKIPDPGTRLAGLALVYSSLHRDRDSEAALTQLISEHSRDEALAIADVFAFRGQNEQAFKWLDTAFALRAHDLVYIKSHLFLKKLQDDPRYKMLLHKLHLPE
jgi:TolB-like protein